MADGGSGWAVNERTNEGTGCGEAWPNDFACYTWIVIFLFLSFIFARSPGGELAHFSSLWWCHYQLGENSLFFSIPTHSSIYVIGFLIYGNFSFFSPFGGWIIQFVWTWIIHVVTPECFTPQKKNNSSCGGTCFRMIFLPLKESNENFILAYLRHRKQQDDDRLDPQSVRHPIIFLLTPWLNIFSTPIVTLLDDLSSHSRNPKTKNWSKVNQPKVYFF